MSQLLASFQRHNQLVSFVSAESGQEEKEQVEEEWLVESAEESDDAVMVTDCNDLENQLNMRTSLKSSLLGLVMQSDLEFESKLQMVMGNQQIMNDIALMFLSGCITCIGWYATRRRRHVRWFQKRFHSTMNVSINHFTFMPASLTSSSSLGHTQVHLSSRTMLHGEWKRMISNEEAGKRLLEVARTKSEGSFWRRRPSLEALREDPLLRFSDDDEEDVIVGYLRNAISTTCAQHWIARDILASVTAWTDNDIENDGDFLPLQISGCDYLMSMCVEPGFEKMSKIRVVLMRKEQLDSLCELMLQKDVDNEFVLDDASNKNSNYQIRWRTILAIARERIHLQETGRDLPCVELSAVVGVTNKPIKLKHELDKKQDKIY